MSGVIGMAELLTHEEGLNDETREIAVRMFRSSKQLLTVLNELLDFSKLEAGRVEMETITFSPRSVIEDVVSLVMSNAQDKGLNVVAEVDDKVPKSVMGDEGKIRQVLLNLAHNAVKFTYDGQIKIAVEVVESNDDSILLKHTVHDTGIGIKAEDQPRLFQPFVQADGTTKRRFGGTGLGLSIAKRFVELMQGEIGVVSVDGKGSTFWFTVPLRKTS